VSGLPCAGGQAGPTARDHHGRARVGRRHRRQVRPGRVGRGGRAVATTPAAGAGARPRRRRRRRGLAGAVRRAPLRPGRRAGGAAVARPRRSGRARLRDRRGRAAGRRAVAGGAQHRAGRRRPGVGHGGWSGGRGGGGPQRPGRGHDPGRPRARRSTAPTCLPTRCGSGRSSCGPAPPPAGRRSGCRSREIRAGGSPSCCGRPAGRCRRRTRSTWRRRCCSSRATPPGCRCCWATPPPATSWSRPCGPRRGCRSSCWTPGAPVVLPLRLPAADLAVPRPPGAVPERTAWWRSCAWPTARPCPPTRCARCWSCRWGRGPTGPRPRSATATPTACCAV
jgi:hypothetical protein